MSSRGWWAALVALLLAGVFGGAYAGAHHRPRPHPSPIPTASPPAPGSCHMRASPSSAGELVLADPACTPGALYAGVDQANIAQTICVKGWTANIRPPLSYTAPLKLQGMKAYGFTDAVSAHEEDHLVPLELGGAPSDPRNLWPEPGATPNRKDMVENYLREQVCAGRLPLADAQAEVRGDWFAVYVATGSPVPR